MTTILIIGIFEALFLGILVLTKRQKAVPDYFLAVLLFVMGFTIVASYIEQYNIVNNYPYPFFIHVSPPLIFLHGPLLWFYIKSFTTVKFKFKPHYLLHFAPFLLAFILMWVSTYSMPAENRIAEMQSENFKANPIYPVMVNGIALFTQGYFIWGLLLISRYRKKIRNYYSKVENIDLSWLKFILVAAIIAYAINSLLFLGDYFLNLLNFQVLQLSTFIVGSLFILTMGFYGLRQTNVFYSVNQPGINVEKQAHADNQQPLQTKDEAFVHQLLEYMNIEKPYLKPDLTLKELSHQLNVSPDYFSGILNRNLHMRFFDFVNQFRVEAFKDACQDKAKQNFSIIAIAYDCGFNSKATFNRVFKNMTGYTPGAYQKKAQ
ncbi:DNA-binding transcriptional regulator MelR [Salinivirga cyanobacteriivorans]|uniref:DNA-binding transcriptional regulator MelR n=1 Tax=Salinivirga cyanobacteriivorans TaxID=1307839 RepID=A0A0S2I0G9_9BACT|nr:helix-turn-helix transcriptional regulator [Salinivirga cyanobacteriivorans]ALO15669.1 DNA-binding transcriptional regulator MelR [Salinivirga cyanobacteriivorans]